MINLSDSIYKYFEDEDNHETSPDSFGPSYLLDCRRKIFWRKTGEEPSNPIDLPARLKMHFGKILHEGLQKIIKNRFNVIESEMKKEITYRGVKFIYYLDALVEHEGEKIIIEIKTMYGRGIDGVKDEPKPNHLAQVAAYMQFEKVDRAIILYAGRDNGYMYQHGVSRSEALTKSLDKRVDKLKTLTEDIEAKKLPERDFEPVIVKGEFKPYFIKSGEKVRGDWQCQYCQYRNKCWDTVIGDSSISGGKYLGEKKLV